jgi:hypothetical protein
MRRRRVYLVSALALTVVAACTISPLNPQPLPPRDDDPENEAAFGDGGSFRAPDAAMAGEDTKDPTAPDAAASANAPEGGKADASPLPPPPADAGDAGDAGPDAEAGAS